MPVAFDPAHRVGHADIGPAPIGTIQEAGVKDADGVSAKVARAFVAHANWRQSEADLRELRKAVTFAVYADVDDLDEVARIVDMLFPLLTKSK